MPAIYAHHSFGKKVYPQLPEHMKQIIRRYPRAFQAGLQGPDFLFFYRPWIRCKTNRLGHSQHKQPFCDFVEKVRPVIRQKGKDSGEYAYLLGFLCHFMLDSESHTYVNQQVKCPGYDHLVMEIEFDRYLMKKAGKNPLIYPIWKSIHWDRDTLDAIHGIYASFDISRENIKKSLKSMSVIKWFLTTGRTFRRLFIRLGMLLTFHYRQLEGQMMDLVPKRTARKTNPALASIYRNTIHACVEQMKLLDDVILTDQPLNRRLHATFQNNTIPND